MSTLITVPSGFYPLKKAQEIARQLNESDTEGWQYKAIDCQNDYGRIDVYDEDNYLIHEGLYL